MAAKASASLLLPAQTLAQLQEMTQAHHCAPEQMLQSAITAAYLLRHPQTVPPVPADAAVKLHLLMQHST